MADSGPYQSLVHATRAVPLLADGSGSTSLDVILYSLSHRVTTIAAYAFATRESRVLLVGRCSESAGNFLGPL